LAYIFFFFCSQISFIEVGTNSHIKRLQEKIESLKNVYGEEEVDNDNPLLKENEENENLNDEKIEVDEALRNESNVENLD